MRDRLVKDLMAARRAVDAARKSGDSDAKAIAHAVADRAKGALGERRQVWWDDGAPDFNRYMARNSQYSDWFVALDFSGKG